MTERRPRKVVVVDNRYAALYVGQRINKRRLHLRLSQKDVAGERFTAAYISALERGLAKPSLSSLLHLSKVLGVRPAYFLEGLRV